MNLPCNLYSNSAINDAIHPKGAAFSHSGNDQHSYPQSHSGNGQQQYGNTFTEA